MAKEKKELKVLDQGNYKDYRKCMANNLLDLVRIHKQQCNSENCPMSTIILYDLYCELIDRKPTELEMRSFL